MRFPLSSPHSISDAAIEAAVTSLRSGRYTMGALVEQFEQQFAAYVGAKHAVMVNSGSSANLLAVEALLRPSNRRPAWKQGDEVLVPALAWSTTVWPLIQLGLKPVFVDIDPQTLNMDLGEAEKAVTPQTRGLMYIHVLGNPGDLDALSRFCQWHGLSLIEDCCEAFGARWQGTHVGTTGTLGTFSHFFSHQLTTMEGGTVVTNDDRIANDLRSMRSHGWTRHRSDREWWDTRTDLDTRFHFVTSGYNVRPMEVQAAIGLEQLQRVEGSAAIREQTAIALDIALTATGMARVIGIGARGHSWMNIPIIADHWFPRFGKVLKDIGIETRPIIAGNITRHHAFAGHLTEFCHADQIVQRGFMVGAHDPAIAEPLAEALKSCAVAA